MSSPLNNEAAERVIPLADAPSPTVSGENSTATGDTSPVTEHGALSRDPLATLKFTPHIIEAVSKVYDPEIPVNIYELGLIYDIEVDSAGNVLIRMTLTAPACPAAQTIPVDVERRVREVAGVNDVKVAVVWDPPWTRDRMSEAAKLTLGML